MMFIKHFVAHMDKNSPRWRQESIITMDNALYHVSSDSLQFYRDLDLPIILNPPHGYNVSPVELVFAAYKATQLNPENMKTGKSNFENIVYIVMRRLKEIPVSTRILYWHHTWTHVLRYLQFIKL